jgi:O-antigen ligase
MIYEYIKLGSLTSPHFTEYYITINRILGAGVPISVFLCFTYKRNWIRAFPVAFTALLLFFMLQTGGRGPLIAAVSSIIIYISWVFIHRENTFTSPSFSGIVILCAILTIVVILGTQISHLDTVNRIQRLLIEGPGDSILTRIRMAEGSIQLFTQSPIFGHGVGAFQTLFASGQYSYPHNIFLEFLVESGAIGFIMFTTYILTILLVILRYGRGTPVYSGLILSVFSFALLNALVSGDIPSNRRLFIYSATVFSLIESK